MTISTVTIAGKNIAMNLTRDPNRNDTEYASKTRHGLNVTNKSLVKITGTVTFGNTTLPFEVEGYLSEKQNVCRGTGSTKGFDLEFESVTIIENRVIIDTKLVTKYQVVGTVSKTETAEIYYVDTYKTAKGYDYVLTAEGEKEVLEDTYTLSLTADKELTEEKYVLDVTKETYIYEDIKGDLIVRYITIFNETLSPNEKSTEKVGTDYKTEQKELIQKTEKLELKLKNYENTKEKELMKYIKEIVNFENIDRNIILNLIDSIEIMDKENIKINYKFTNM